MKKYIIEVNKGGEFISGEVSQKAYERFKYFVDNYTFERDLNGRKDTKLGLLLPKDERVCRFCQKGHPEVKFETKAHTIPQQWGRCKPINLFECDDYNGQFSKWETDFGDYFLINRALIGSKKKKGYPKYKTKSSTQIESISPDKLDLSESDREKVIKKIGKDKFVILIRQGNIEEVKREGNMIYFNLLRKPFRPINVYKVFLKIGLSLIPEIDLPKFTFLLKLLNSDREIPKEKEDSFSGFSIIHSQFSTFKSIFEFPIVSLYKKNVQSSNFIERVMVIFFRKFILSNSFTL
jgi:hypothetical protein